MHPLRGAPDCPSIYGTASAIDVALSRRPGRTPRRRDAHMLLGIPSVLRAAS